MKLKNLIFALTLTTFLSVQANDVTTVSQVTESVALTTATDYTITSTDPFGSLGTIDIQNVDAVVIFQNIRPSVVVSKYLQNITINGEALSEETNARIGIWGNGCVIYPHVLKYSNALTVYTEGNFTGESRTDFIPYTKYTNLGDFKDNIESFILKRGYMATLATNTDGSGYSRVFIAQDEDLEIDLTLTNVDSGKRKYLLNKVAFIRVFPWNKVTKKGNAGGDSGQLRALDVTWYYDWNSGGSSTYDWEYVPHHHHEGWPAWSGLTGSNHNTILGNNEPNNQSDSKEQYIEVSKIESTFFGTNGSWQNNAYAGGQRLGSPAMTSGNSRSSWLTTFMSLAEKYNCRIDFICDHYYVHNNGGNYSWNVNANASTYGGRPTWITEWNYGANWTTSGESWPTSDMSASDANQTVTKNALKDILENGLENNANCERYAIYNWVQDARAVYLNSKLTIAGEYYASLKSNTSYSNGGGYIPGWNFWSPSDLELTYNKNSKKVVLNWSHLNGKQTDSVCVQRKVVDESNVWETIANLGVVQSITPSYNYDDVSAFSGVITYRIANYDSDGKTRYSDEASLTIGSASGNNMFQYGKLTVTNLEQISTEFSESFDDTPAIFMGTITNKNTKIWTGNLVLNASKNKFSYQILPGKNSTTSEMDYNEEIPFMAIPEGNYTWGNMKCEVAVTKINGDGIEVTFKEPFPEDVTPIVLTELRNPTLKSNPISIRIWDVTNTGFKAIPLYEEAVGTGVRVNQNLCYFAVSPGFATIDNELGIMIAAGKGTTEVKGASNIREILAKENSDESIDTLYLNNPKYFGDLQTYNYKSATLLRRGTDIYVTDTSDPHYKYLYGVRVKRIVDSGKTTDDEGNKLSTNTADDLGWVAIASYDANSSVPDDFDTAIEVVKTEGAQLVPYVINRIIYVENIDKYDVYSMTGAKVAANATQTPGVYIVKSGKKTAKVIVK